MGPLDPCREAYLGIELRSWFLSHSSLAQHDAGEFLGWLWEAMFRQNIRLWPFQGWEARLENEVVDRGTTLSPIVLRNLPHEHVQLQQLIQEWYNSQPYVSAVPVPFAFKFERYSKHQKNLCADSGEDATLHEE